MNRDALKDELKELMQEVLDEMSLEELSLDERNKENKAKKDDFMTKRGSEIERMPGGDFGFKRARMHPDAPGTAAHQRRIARGNASSAASRYATPAQSAAIHKAQSKFSSGTKKVKNPETGKDILATTALAAGSQHPAYQAARSALKKEIANLHERNKENKAKKDAYQTDLGRSSRSTPLKQGRIIGRGGSQDHLQGRQLSVKSEPTKPSHATIAADPSTERRYNRNIQNRRVALKRDIKAGTQALRTSPTGSPKASYLEPSAVPPDIQKVASKDAGGKVVFGKYFDATGTFLGSLKQGKWVPAGPRNSQGTLEETKIGVIRLTNILNESANMAARRINLVRVQTIMEKLYPELTDTQSKKLMELCMEVHMMASQLNMKPYIRTENSLVEWSILLSGFHSKLCELKEEVTKVCEDKKINPSTVVKAIDQVLEY